MPSERLRARLRVGFSVLFVTLGILHFVRPRPFLKIMPPYLPWHTELVYLSGFFEIVGGIGLLVRPLRRAAGWGLVALLIAVFPANVQMFGDLLAEQGWSAWTIGALLRLPLQGALILGVWWCTRNGPA
ncbi:MAG TPA: DoxX family protein [Gemmataceae bacterium]|nr:DoxX family protein [Gemmataceae bacterium]